MPQFKEAIDSDNVEKCKKVPNNRMENECYLYFAKKNNNFDICERSKATDLFAPKQDWIDGCYIKVSLENKDFSHCNKISSIETRDKCYGYAGRDTKDDSFCSNIENNAIKEACINAVNSEYDDGEGDQITKKAKELKNAEICKNN